MANHVFVSYKHEEQAFVEMLIRQLEAAGFPVWIDTEQLQATWRVQIVADNHAAQRQLQALLALLTNSEGKADESPKCGR